MTELPDMNSMKITTERAEELARNAEDVGTVSKLEWLIEISNVVRALVKDRDELTEKQRLSTEMLRRACISSIEKDKQLAAAQAAIAKLRDDVRVICGPVMESYAARHRLLDYENLVSAQSDDTALRKMLATQREASAKVCQDDESGRECNSYFANAIRSTALVID